MKRISDEEIKSILGDIWDSRYIPKIQQRERIRQLLEAQLQADKAKIPEIQAEERKKIGKQLFEKHSVFIHYSSIKGDVEALKSGEEVQ